MKAKEPLTMRPQRDCGGDWVGRAGCWGCNFPVSRALQQELAGQRRPEGARTGINKGIVGLSVLQVKIESRLLTVRLSLASESQEIDEKREPKETNTEISSSTSFQKEGKRDGLGRWKMRFRSISYTATALSRIIKFGRPSFTGQTFRWAANSKITSLGRPASHWALGRGLIVV